MDRALRKIPGTDFLNHCRNVTEMTISVIIGLGYTKLCCDAYRFVLITVFHGDSMKKFNIILILILLLSGAALGLVSYNTVFSGGGETTPTPTDALHDYQNTHTSDISSEIRPNIIYGFSSYGLASDIYTIAFRDDVRSRLNYMIDRARYTEDEPLVIYNPFATDECSLYIYFTTDYPCAVSYEVHTSNLVSDAADFGGYVEATKRQVVDENGNVLYVGDSTIHEFSIHGLISGVTNTITIRMIDEKGNVRNRRFYYDFDKVNKDEVQLLKANGTKTIVDETTGESSVVPASDISLTEGLYATFTAKNDYTAFMRMYDNDGFLRWKMPMEDNTAKRLFTYDGQMGVFVSDRKLVVLNSLGEIQRIFESEGGRLVFGDFCLDPHKMEDGSTDLRVICIATDRQKKTVNDCVVSISFAENRISKLMDLQKLLEKYPNVHDEKWINLCSIKYMGDNMILLGSDTLNTLIKVRRIYNQPRIVYMLGDKANFTGTKEYDSLFLLQEEDFPYTTSVTQMGFMTYDGWSAADRHYLWVLDQNKDYEYGKKEEHSGYFERYLVDERTFSVKRVTHRPMPAITDDTFHDFYGSNIFYATGKDSYFSEYDNAFNLISRFTYKKTEPDKTVEDRDEEEDNPPPDDSIIFTGISKIEPTAFFLTKDVIIYKDGSQADDKESEESK